MPDKFFRAGLTSSRITKDDLEAQKVLVEAAQNNPNLKRALERFTGESNLTAIFRGDFIKDPFGRPTKNPFPTKPPAPGQPAPSDPPDDPVSQIDVEIQLLLNAIPIANDGQVIYSEYHNSLRKALIAIANRLGLTIEPAAQLAILNFAPNFLPISTHPEDDPAWEVTLNKAAIPLNIAGANVNVRGGFVVQMPDGADIQSMIVRGKRVDDGNKDKDPKSLKVALNRIKFDLADAKPTPIIEVELKTEKSVFKKEKPIVTSDLEDFDEVTKRARILDRQRIKNATHQYFVTANYSDGDDSARFEIHSIQILCNL